MMQCFLLGIFGFLRGFLLGICVRFENKGKCAFVAQTIRMFAMLFYTFVFSLQCDLEIQTKGIVWHQTRMNETVT